MDMPIVYYYCCEHDIARMLDRDGAAVNDVKTTRYEKDEAHQSDSMHQNLRI